LGEALVIRLTRLSEAVTADRVTVEVAGVRHPAQQIFPVSDRTDEYEILFLLGLTVPTGEAVPLVVVVDGRESLPALIPIVP